MADLEDVFTHNFGLKSRLIRKFGTGSLYRCGKRWKARRFPRASLTSVREAANISEVKKALALTEKSAKFDFWPSVPLHDAVEEAETPEPVRWVRGTR
jgi:hypothetical protein